MMSGSFLLLSYILLEIDSLIRDLRNDKISPDDNRLTALSAGPPATSPDLPESSIRSSEMFSDPQATGFFAALEADAEQRAAQKKISIKKATEFKDSGNRLFRASKFEQAIAEYTSGLAVCRDMVSLLVNRAQAFLKLHKYAEAMKDCTAAIELDSQCVKAFVRRAKAEAALLMFDDAILDLESALQFAPSSHEIPILLDEYRKEHSDLVYEDEVSRQLAAPTTASTEAVLEEISGVLELASRVIRDKATVLSGDRVVWIQRLQRLQNSLVCDPKFVNTAVRISGLLQVLWECVENGFETVSVLPTLCLLAENVRNSRLFLDLGAPGFCLSFILEAISKPNVVLLDVSMTRKQLIGKKLEELLICRLSAETLMQLLDNLISYDHVRSVISISRIVEICSVSLSLVSWPALVAQSCQVVATIAKHASFVPDLLLGNGILSSLQSFILRYSFSSSDLLLIGKIMQLLSVLSLHKTAVGLLSPFFSSSCSLLRLSLGQYHSVRNDACLSAVDSCFMFLINAGHAGLCSDIAAAVDDKGLVRELIEAIPTLSLRSSSRVLLCILTLLGKIAENSAVSRSLIQYHIDAKTFELLGRLEMCHPPVPEEVPIYSQCARMLSIVRHEVAPRVKRTAGAIAKLARLLDYRDATVVGNVALFLSEAVLPSGAESPDKDVCAQMLTTGAIDMLLRILDNSSPNIGRNCAICLGKLSRDKDCYERIRELHGLDILRLRVSTILENS
eukprot:ANDGO_03583.mRNA.2 Translocon at the outer membrane of chloroplasts 64